MPVIKPIGKSISVPLIKTPSGKVTAKMHKPGKVAAKPMKLKRTSMTASKAVKLMRKRISKSQLRQLRTRQKLIKKPKADTYRPFSSAGGVKITPFKSPVVRKGVKTYGEAWISNYLFFPPYYEPTGHYSLGRQVADDRLTTAKKGEFSAYFSPREEPGWKNLSKTFVVTVEAVHLAYGAKNFDMYYLIYVDNQLLQVNKLDDTHYCGMFTSTSGSFCVKAVLNPMGTIGSITVKRFELN